MVLNGKSLASPNDCERLFDICTTNRSGIYEKSKAIQHKIHNVDLQSVPNNIQRIHCFEGNILLIFLISYKLIRNNCNKMGFSFLIKKKKKKKNAFYRKTAAVDKPKKITFM